MTLVSVPSLFRNGNGFNPVARADTFGMLGAQSNFSDYIGPSPESQIWAQWTLGATQIDQFNLEPTISENWSLLSVTFQAYLAMVAGMSTNISPTVWSNGHSYGGKLGKLIAGVLFGSDVQVTEGVNNPATPGGFDFNSLNGNSNSPMMPLPTDETLTTVLFDPDSEALPPVAIPQSVRGGSPAINQLLPVAGTVTLSIPRPLIPGSGTSLGVGLWLTPSLLCQNNFNFPNQPQTMFGLAVCYASYIVNYDNGISPPLRVA